MPLLKTLGTMWSKNYTNFNVLSNIVLQNCYHASSLGPQTLLTLLQKCPNTDLGTFVWVCTNLL